MSSYSPLKFELIDTGAQTGTWGATTNNNFLYGVEEAITGSADVVFASADVTLVLVDVNTAQTARNLRLSLIGTSGGARNLFVPAIEKQYIISNTLADAVTVKNSSGTGIKIPAGSSAIVFNNGVNVVAVNTAIPISSTLTFKLPTTDGSVNQAIITDGAGNLSFGSVDSLPAQAGNANKLLTTNGSAASWTSSLTSVTLAGYSEFCTTIGTISTATYNLDVSTANVFDITLGTNVTLTFTNYPSAGFSKPNYFDC